MLNFLGIIFKKVSIYYNLFRIIISARKPKWILYFKKWSKSLNNYDFLLENNLPWIVFEATDFLKSILKKNMVVFEYGSGGSTLFLSKNIKKIISVENNPIWYSKISKILKEKKINNCTYFLVEHDPTNSFNLEYTNSSYTSTSSKYKNKNFENYVKTIDSYDDENFDLVFIDGRARNSCIHHSINKIKLGGYLVLDNSNRKTYVCGMSLLSEWERIDFFGPAPCVIFLCKTTIWRKPIKIR